MHIHVVGRGNDINQVNDNVFFYPEDNNTLLTRVLYKLVEKTLGEVGADFDQSGTIDTNEYLNLIYKSLGTSKEIQWGGFTRSGCPLWPKVGETRQEKNRPLGFEQVLSQEGERTE